eukprot:349608-Chlamydomonas_euryale.AAC.17
MPLACGLRSGGLAGFHSKPRQGQFAGRQTALGGSPCHGSGVRMAAHSMASEAWAEDARSHCRTQLHVSDAVAVRVAEHQAVMHACHACIHV